MSQLKGDVKLQWTTGATQLAVRASVAATVSLAMARFLQLDYPIYAFLAAIIATDLTPLQSRQLGLRRLIATVVGAVCGALGSPILPQAAWAIGFGILVAMFISQLLQVRTGAKMAGYICAIVMLNYGSEPWTYALLRLLETALGVIVAWAISYVPKLLHTEPVGTTTPAQLSPATWFQVDGALPNGVGLYQLGDLQLTLRVASAATLSIVAAKLLELQYPVFACIAAVVTTDLAPEVSRRVGLSRIVTTLVGAVFAVLLGWLLPTQVWVIGLGILLSMLACQLVNSTEGAKLAACVCGIVMLMHGGDVLGFAFHRVIETGLGVVAAWAISYVPKLITTETESGGQETL